MAKSRTKFLIAYMLPGDIYGSVTIIRKDGAKFLDPFEEEIAELIKQIVSERHPPAGLMVTSVSRIK